MFFFAPAAIIGIDLRDPSNKNFLISKNFFYNCGNSSMAIGGTNHRIVNNTIWSNQASLYAIHFSNCSCAYAVENNIFDMPIDRIVRQDPCLNCSSSWSKTRTPIGFSGYFDPMNGQGAYQEYVPPKVALPSFCGNGFNMNST